MKHRNDLDEWWLDGVLVRQKLVRRVVEEFTNAEVYDMFSEEQRERIRSQSPKFLELLLMNPVVTAEQLESHLLKMKDAGLLSEQEWDAIANSDVNNPVPESAIDRRVLEE